jgi:hypothetical protein
MNLELDLIDSVRDSMTVYPASINGVKRTEWQEG